MESAVLAAKPASVDNLAMARDMIRNLETLDDATEVLRVLN